MTTVTASQLRADVYRLLDQVLETGEPLEIKRNGRVLRLVPEDAGSKLARIRPIEGLIVGDPDDLLLPTPSEWDPDGAVGGG